MTRWDQMEIALFVGFDKCMSQHTATENAGIRGTKLLQVTVSLRVELLAGSMLCPTGHVL
jgi:hypothetical protein